MKRTELTRIQRTDTEQSTEGGPTPTGSHRQARIDILLQTRSPVNQSELSKSRSTVPTLCPFLVGISPFNMAPTFSAILFKKKFPAIELVELRVCMRALEYNRGWWSLKTTHFPTGGERLALPDTQSSASV